MGSIHPPRSGTVKVTRISPLDKAANGSQTPVMEMSKMNSSPNNGTLDSPNKQNGRPMKLPPIEKEAKGPPQGQFGRQKSITSLDKDKDSNGNNQRGSLVSPKPISPNENGSNEPPAVDLGSPSNDIPLDRESSDTAPWGRHTKISPLDNGPKDPKQWDLGSTSSLSSLEFGSAPPVFHASKCKKLIRLSPSSKKKHSKSRDSKEDASTPGSSGISTSDMAKSKDDQRVPNGVHDHDLKHVFEMFDKNNDGKISSEELGCVLRTLGHDHSPKEVDDMIKNADTNENGYVEYDEFLTMMRRFNDDNEADPSAAEAKKREAFKVFDMDGNGFIDKHELKCVMRRLGENLSEDDLKAMFTEADLNGDGLIDFDEFSRLNMA